MRLMEGSGVEGEDAEKEIKAKRREEEAISKLCIFERNFFFPPPLVQSYSICKRFACGLLFFETNKMNDTKYGIITWSNNLIITNFQNPHVATGFQWIEILFLVSEGERDQTRKTAFKTNK